MTTILEPTTAAAFNSALAALRSRALVRLRELETDESPCPDLWAKELADGDESLAAPLADLIAQDHARLLGEA